ncbi:MAG TPA: hypothetical protein VJ372_02440 [Pyrinomonadaceae bacterium]|jgi:hypothetical protein|nr:hypothetical protein [Pyrinomonadaceae bacterium]
MHKSFGKLVGGFVLLALVNVGMSAIFCPHMAGSSHNCLEHQSTRDAPQARHEHQHLQGMSAMSDETSADDQTGGELISPFDAPCSHCLNHSQAKIGYTLSGLVPTSPFYVAAPADSSTRLVTDLPSSVTLMDLHGHSPPSQRAVQYILKSSLRI